MTYRAPKRDISRSGLRSWMRRHPVFGQRLPPGQELRFIYRAVSVDFGAAIKACTEELHWFRDVPQTDTMPG